MAHIPVINFPMLEKEMGHLRILIYKNTNQYRNAHWFKRLLQVHKLYLKFRSLRMFPIQRAFTEHSANGAESNAVRFYASRLQEGGRLVCKMLYAIESACDFLQRTLSMTYFMPLCLVVLASLSRCFVLLHELYEVKIKGAHTCLVTFPTRKVGDPGEAVDSMKAAAARSDFAEYADPFEALPSLEDLGIFHPPPALPDTANNTEATGCASIDLGVPLETMEARRPAAAAAPSTPSSTQGVALHHKRKRSPSPEGHSPSSAPKKKKKRRKKKASANMPSAAPPRAVDRSMFALGSVVSANSLTRQRTGNESGKNSDEAQAKRKKKKKKKTGTAASSALDDIFGGLA